MIETGSALRAQTEAGVKLRFGAAQRLKIAGTNPENRSFILLLGAYNRAVDSVGRYKQHIPRLKAIHHALDYIVHLARVEKEGLMKLMVMALEKLICTSLVQS